MKARVLSFAIALLVFLNLADAFAQNPHFVGTPCYDPETNTISGKVAGLGTNANGLTITITGQYGCQNPGGNRPPAWQNFTIPNVPLASSGRPGQYTFTANLGSLPRPCPNQNWDVVYQSLRACISGTNVCSNVTMGCP